VTVEQLSELIKQVGVEFAEEELRKMREEN
jgi:hypothetical protein